MKQLSNERLRAMCDEIAERLEKDFPSLAGHPLLLETSDISKLVKLSICNYRGSCTLVIPMITSRSYNGTYTEVKLDLMLDLYSRLLAYMRSQ